MKQSAQSHLTSCEIKGDLKVYNFLLAWKVKSFRKDGDTRCSSYFWLGVLEFKILNFFFPFAFIFSLAIFSDFQCINL